MQPQQPDPTSRRPELRYVAASGLSRHVLNLERREVTGTDGEALGSLDGFLVDTASGQPEFIVVSAGGWLNARRYLIPADQARFDEGERGLRADLDRETVARFPEIDDRRIEALRHDELGRYRDDVSRVCCPDDTDLRRLDRARGAHTTGTWWSSTGWLTSMVSGAPSVSAGGAVDERLTGVAETEPRAEAPPERVGDAPAVGERAQPGDVLGIESGGETTSIGDRAEDEDRRRERAEEDLRTRRPPRERG